eukprot:4091805-Pyramimonas_sp.AAC.1
MSPNWRDDDDDDDDDDDVPPWVRQPADARTCAALAHALVEGGQPARALALVDGMVDGMRGTNGGSGGVRPNRICLNLALRACAALGDGGKALETYDLMQVRLLMHHERMRIYI